MTSGKIACQAFQAAHRLLQAAATDPELAGLMAQWEEEGTRTICRVAETPAVFARACREVRGITFVDEGIYGCPPGSATVHATWPLRRSETPRILSHKRLPLLVTPG